jgi:RNA polymerase sigma-70 factor (ECF subfamily)
LFDFLTRKKYSSLSDEDLILLYKKEKSNLIMDNIYKRYGHLLLAIAIKYVRNREEAQDIVMNLFEKLGDKIAKHDIQNFKSWLHTTLKNECLMHLRKTKKINSTTTIENLENIVSELDSEEFYQTKEKVFNELESSLSELKNEQRKSVELFYLENKSYVEIAEILNISLNNVKSAIQNGKRMLKLKMENKGVNLTEL